MSHSAYANEFLEILGDELRAVVRDDSGSCVGESLARSLDDRLNFGFRHALADLPVDDETAAAIELSAKVKERARDIDVRDINMPVLVGPKGLDEAFAL